MVTQLYNSIIQNSEARGFLWFNASMGRKQTGSRTKDRWTVESMEVGRYVSRLTDRWICRQMDGQTGRWANM